MAGRARAARAVWRELVLGARIAACIGLPPSGPCGPPSQPIADQASGGGPSACCQATAARRVYLLPLEREVGKLLAVESGFVLLSPARMLVACGMQRCHQEALKKNRVMLAKQLVLKELMEHMIEKDIITTEMMEMIQVCRLYSTVP